jgi:predicted O-methyltransferase YrrM
MEIKKREKLDIKKKIKKNDDIGLLSMNEIKNRIKKETNRNKREKYYFNLIERYRMTYLNGKNYKIHSAIKKEEGENIRNLMKKYHLEKCIEVGMAFGISASYILHTNKKATLTSIDPNQTSVNDWNSFGLKLIKELKFDNRHTLLEKKSYIALPELLEKNGMGSFDFVFIDGFHTFDYTLIDFFYADKLIKVGGIILVDDILHKSVQQCIDYLNKNYLFYKRVPCYKTQAAYMKIREDDRSWNFHVDF